jgi:uncharacterized protein (DUF433 family)
MPVSGLGIVAAANWLHGPAISTTAGDLTSGESHQETTSMTDNKADSVIECDPKHGFGKPLFFQSGAPVDAVLERLGAGEALDEVAYDFGLSPAEIEYCQQEEGQQ